MTEALQKTQTSEVAQVQEHSPSEMVMLAIDRQADPATLSKLMDLQERWDAMRAKKAFTAAMASFKREAPAVIGKDRSADFGAGKAKYSYATTGAIVTAITPALSKNGLSLSWETQQGEKTITVTCHVTHSAGHRESAILSGPRDESGGKNPIQQIGSSVHYLQRYTMVSVLGLATADMDDPDDADQRPPVSMPKAKAATPAPAPAASGLQTVSDVIVSAEKKTGKKQNGGEWTRWRVDVGGVACGTFDAETGLLAEQLMAAKVPVAMTYQDDGKGHLDIVSLVAAD